MNNRKIRVAVGGQGRSGYGIHCECLRQDTDRFDIVAVITRYQPVEHDSR